MTQLHVTCGMWQVVLASVYANVHISFYLIEISLQKLQQQNSQYATRWKIGYIANMEMILWQCPSQKQKQ